MRFFIINTRVFSRMTFLSQTCLLPSSDILLLYCISRMSEMQNKVGYECVQLHGGWGYMWEYPISKSYVDAKVQTIYGGSNEIMKELISRQIIGDKRI